jgi:hypothetical protein
MAERFQQAPIVEPVDPLQGHQIQLFQAAPGTQAANHLRLVEADHDLCERIVVAVAAHRGLQPSVCKPISVL